mmetsp:Transcript_87369/g.227936  ORF Transcript_87369/g.227936 Transcript_87369/m.227936 type:complete len:655 (+) Transcript_87369:875-2839(+)
MGPGGGHQLGAHHVVGAGVADQRTHREERRLGLHRHSRLRHHRRLVAQRHAMHDAAVVPGHRAASRAQLPDLQVPIVFAHLPRLVDLVLHLERDVHVPRVGDAEKVVDTGQDPCSTKRDSECAEQPPRQHPWHLVLMPRHDGIVVLVGIRVTTRRAARQPSWRVEEPAGPLASLAEGLGGAGQSAQVLDRVCRRRVLWSPRHRPIPMVLDRLQGGPRDVRAALHVIVLHLHVESAAGLCDGGVSTASVDIRPALCRAGLLHPPEHVQVEHRSERMGQEGAVVLRLDAAEHHDEPEQDSVRRERGYDQPLRQAGALEVGEAPVVGGDAADHRAVGEEELDRPQLPHLQRHVQPRQGFRQDDEQNDAVGSRSTTPGLHENVPEHVVGQRQQQLVGADAQGDPGERVVGLPVRHRLVGEPHVPQPGDLGANIAAQPLYVVPAALQAPGVRRGGSRFLVGATRRAACAINRQPLRRGVLHEPLLRPHDEGHPEHLLALRPLKVRGVGTAAFDLLPRWHWQAHELGQQSRLVALSSHGRVHGQPHGEQQKHEGAGDGQGAAHHQPVRRLGGQAPLAPERHGGGQHEHVHQQVGVHLVLGERHEVTDVLPPELGLGHLELQDLELLREPEVSVIQEVIPVVVKAGLGAERRESSHTLHPG